MSTGKRRNTVGKSRVDRDWRLFPLGPPPGFKISWKEYKSKGKARARASQPSQAYSLLSQL